MRMYHPHGQHDRRSNVFPSDPSFQQHPHSNRRPTRGRGYGILREPPHLGGYNDESRFPVRSRGPVLNHGRYWNSDRNASEHNHRASEHNHHASEHNHRGLEHNHHASEHNHRGLEHNHRGSEYNHRASEYNHRQQRGFSASPNSNYHHPPMMDHSQRPSSAYIAQLNERVRFQIGNQSYQVERRYARPVDQFNWSSFQQATSGFTSFEDGHRRQGHQSNYTHHNINNQAGGTYNSGAYYVDTDPERNNTETEDFIPFEDDSKSTEVSTVNDPEIVKEEEASAQNFNINDDDDPGDDSGDEDVVFIGETVRFNEAISRSTSQEPIELDAPAQTATRPASYSEVSVEYFYCHICHTHLDDAPSFMQHIDSEEHQVMLNMLEESNKIRIQLLRFEAKRLERIRSAESRNRVEQRHACTLCTIAYNGNVDEHRSCSVHRKLQDLLRPYCRICKMEFSTAIDRESHRLTLKHLQAKEKADKVALAEVLEKTCVEVVNLDDRHDENSNPIDLEVVQEDQSVNERSLDSSKSFNETRRSAEPIPISADKTYEDELIQSYLDKEPEIAAVKALYCSGCREYFAFEENAVHIHRQSARHLKGTHTSAGNSSEWNELQVAQNDEPSPASIGAPNTTQSSRNDLESVPAECAVTSSPVKQIPNASSELAAPNSACESTTPSATTESAASVATVSSTSPFAPVITNTFSLANLSADPPTENVASSDIQCHVADTNPAPTSTTQLPALVPIVVPLTTINQQSDVEMNSPPEMDNPAPPPSKSVSVASQTEEPSLLDGKAVVAKPTMPTTPDTSIPATVSTLPGSATGTDAQTTKPSARSKFDISNFVLDPYEQLMKESHILKNIIRRIRAGVKVMVVLRGIPGSGKSHLANRLKGQGIVVSYDDFLTDLDGKYNWNDVSAVHAVSMALKEVQAAANSGQQLIIVDGHNLMSKQVSHYQKVAKTYDYKFFIVEPNTPWKYDIKMCALKNVHGLTFDQISKIAGPYVKAKMRKIANKQAKKTAKKQQAQNQAKNQTQNQAQKQSAGSRQVSKKGKRPRTLNQQAPKPVVTNDANEPPQKKIRRR